MKSFAIGRCCGLFCATSVLNVINSPGFIASCLDPKVGDVAYGGGSQLVNNATRDAFQTYLHGQVPVEALRNRKKWDNLLCWCVFMEMWSVSKNRGTPKSSILIGFSIINHPLGVFPLFLVQHPCGVRLHESFVCLA